MSAAAPAISVADLSPRPRTQVTNDSPTGTSLGVIVTHGRVVVDGALSSGSSIRDAIAEIEKIEGVTSVTNNTVTVASGYGP